MPAGKKRVSSSPRAKSKSTVRVNRLAKKGQTAKAKELHYKTLDRIANRKSSGGAGSKKKMG